MDHRQLIICLLVLLGYTSSGINGQDYGIRPLTTGKLITPSGDTNVVWPIPGSESQYGGGGGILGTLTGLGGSYPSGTYSANGVYPGTMGSQYAQVSSFGSNPYGGNPYQAGVSPYQPAVNPYQSRPPYPYQSGTLSGMFTPSGQQQAYYPNGYNTVPGTYGV